MAAVRPKGLVRLKGMPAPSEVYPPTGAEEISHLDPNRVGIVFIHGIGSQPACETLLDWSAPIVSLLTDWRKEHEYTPEDPVVRCSYDFSGAGLPILELAVPEHEGHPAQSWVMTEAWWASVTRPPTLASMTAYVSRAMPRIMKGIQEGYDVRQTQLRRTLAVASRAASRASRPAVRPESTSAAASPAVAGASTALPIAGPLSPTAAAVSAAATPAPPDVTAPAQDAELLTATAGRRWAWIDPFDRVQKRLTVLAFGPALVLGTVVLAVYAPFRAIPIKAIQDLAVLKSADNFLTRWFGEIPDILDDPVQAANVRFRLVNAVRGLRKEGCGRVIVVAHSGGAIVSFTTLLDPVYLDERVDKLVTLGQGLALAWRIQDAWSERQPLGSRLTGDLLTVRPALRWADFWSSYDPAPGGPLRPPPGVRLRDMTNPTVNRMSILEDHGSYWDNDEEFLMPLLRHLDTPDGVPSASRFYADLDRRTVRSERRRQRVAVLALWRWLVASCWAIPIFLGSVASLLHMRPGPERLGADIGRWWQTVPGYEFIATPLNAVAHAATWPEWPRIVGQWLLGSAAVVLAAMIVQRIGVGEWERWDRTERREARLRVLQPISRRRAATAFLVLAIAIVAIAAFFLWWFWR